MTRVLAFGDQIAATLGKARYTQIFAWNLVQRHMSSGLLEIRRRWHLASPSLVLAGLAVFLPFIFPYHDYPLLTFYGEWMAFLIGLLVVASVLLRMGDDPPLLPWLSLSLFGLCVVLFFQISIGLVAYPQRSVLGVMYALWAAILVWSGAGLRERFGLERASCVLAGFIAAGGWLVAITGYMQFFQIETIFGRLVEGAPLAGMYGVLAQRNLFANYVACGIASVGFLIALRRIGIVTGFLLAIPMAVAMAYAGSRGAWVYLAIILLASIWFASRAEAMHKSTRLRVIVFAGVMLSVFVLFRLGPAGDAVPRGGDGLAC